MKMTSAYANKMVRSLEEDKVYWLKQEDDSSTYVVANNEEPVIPDYNYEEVSKTLAEIDRKIAIIKHAINLSNATAEISVGDEKMSVDTILIKMAQLNRRKNTLDAMRKQLPKAREEQRYAARNAVPEYRYVNYDLEVVKRDYETISAAILAMQMALDIHNQTVEFEVEL